MMTESDKEKLIEFYKFSSTGVAKTILDLITETQLLNELLKKVVKENYNGWELNPSTRDEIEQFLRDKK